MNSVVPLAASSLSTCLSTLLAGAADAGVGAAATVSAAMASAEPTASSRRNRDPRRASGRRPRLARPAHPGLGCAGGCPACLLGTACFLP